MCCAALLSCRKEPDRAPPAAPDAAPLPAPKRVRPAMPWEKAEPLGEGETFVLGPTPGRMAVAEARAAGLLVVDLGDEWVPFIFSEQDPGGEHKPNPYRKVFTTLANNRATPDELFLESADGQRAVLAAAGLPPITRKAPPTPEQTRALNAARRVLRGERWRNYLEVYGIPPTLSVLRTRLEEDRGRTCYDQVDQAALASFTGTVTYQTRDQARREYEQAMADAEWAEKLLGTPPDGATLPASTVPPAPGQPEAPAAAPSPLDDPKVQARLERTRRGQERLRVIRAVQARLICEGLLGGKVKYTDGMFDLASHEALADWERKNDIFGWGFIGDETLAALQRSPFALHLETFERILAERVADAAGIIEDGSVARGRKPATYRDEAGQTRPVPDLIGEHVAALKRALEVETPEDMIDLLLRLDPAHLPRLLVALPAPALPPYYAPSMELSVEIDRGDIWYDFPWDAKGKPIVQRRQRFPHLTLFVHWNKQRIPLARWRTTIGSWRSELGRDGKLYYKYKNSDVGPRIWKNVVAAPVWIPPDSTPGKELLTRKVFDRNVGPVTVVNTDVMGPGFQSAYGLVMAIHHQKVRGGGLFDNQIRTHGSVDYTSIARRFSHGCHRLVNNRAVRLFDFVLKRRPYQRTGNVPVGPMRRRFSVDGKEYEYTLNTRGYYYELTPPIPVDVLEGRIMGKVQKPITAYVRKPGVDYGPEAEGADAPSLGP